MSSSFHFWPRLKESWPTTSLGTTFPTTSVAATYLLLHVGAVQRNPTTPGDLEVLCYFRLCPTIDNVPAGESILVELAINLRHAAVLLPGTRWSPQGTLLQTGLPVYCGHRTVLLGAEAPRLHRLAALPVPDAIVPPVLRASLNNAWCAAITGQAGTLLIPCFELLRAFYYEAGGALIDFFGSRVPLERVCWSIAAPSATTNFVAHFCVAAQLTHPHQARVLAELFFNPAYRATIRRAHADLALQWRTAPGRFPHPRTHLKAAFHLGRAVPVVAHGTSFTVNGRAYFWVSRLLPASNWFGFSGIVYHPLERKRVKFDSPFVPLPAFTDVLHPYRKTHYKKALSLKQWPCDNTPQLFLPVPHLPPVHCSFPWARRLLAYRRPVYADKNACGYLWDPSPHVTGRAKWEIAPIVAFQALILCLRHDGCDVQQLEINNPGRRHGRGYSVFPYMGPPTANTHTKDRRQRLVSFLHIGRDSGHFYVLQVANSNAAVLAYNEDLAGWSLDDCNVLLRVAAKNPLNWGPSWLSVNLATGPHPLTYVHRGGTPVAVADWCCQHIRTAVADRNRSIDVAGQAGR